MGMASMRSNNLWGAMGSGERYFSQPSLPTRTAAKVTSTIPNRFLAAARLSEPPRRRIPPGGRGLRFRPCDLAAGRPGGYGLRARRRGRRRGGGGGWTGVASGLFPGEVGCLLGGLRVVADELPEAGDLARGPLEEEAGNAALEGRGGVEGPVVVGVDLLERHGLTGRRAEAAGAGLHGRGPQLGAAGAALYAGARSARLAQGFQGCEDLSVHRAVGEIRARVKVGDRA